MTSLRDMHVLVLGLGDSGLAMARWCAREGAHVSVADTRSEPPQLAALREELPQVNFIGGQQRTTRSPRNHSLQLASVGNPAADVINHLF